MTALIDDIKKNISGDVFCDEKQLQSFSRDESIFSIQPKFIVQPKNCDDVKAAIQIAMAHHIPITGRGGGSGIAGQSIGTGIIVDFSKYMSNILDVEENCATVQPGVILKNLNELLSKRNKKFAPDPGSKDYCTIGGMVGTNAAGPRAMIYGSTKDHVMDLEIMLSDAEKYSCSDLSKKFTSLTKEMNSQKVRIQKAQRNVEKNSSGYDLLPIAQKNPAYERLIVGSEGTLGLVVNAKLKIVDLPKKKYFAVFVFPTMKRAVMEVAEIRKHKPACIELLNESIIQMFRNVDNAFVEEIGMMGAGAALWVEWENEIPDNIRNECAFVTSDESLIKKIGSERSMVSKYLHSHAEKQNRKPLRCIEDACLPMDKIGTFVDEVMCTLIAHDVEGSIFGHVGSGHFHINPNIRTDIPNLSGRIHALMDEFYELVLELGGTVSGEHGDGILRAKYAHAQWKDIWDLFELIKKTFDPTGLFNPDKKVPVHPTSWPNFRAF